MIEAGVCILVEGYGQLKGREEVAKFCRTENGNVVLLLHEDGDDYEIPFGKDGRILNGSNEGGYEIPAEVLKALKPVLRVWTNPNPPTPIGETQEEPKQITRRKLVASNNSETLRTKKPKPAPAIPAPAVEVKTGKREMTPEEKAAFKAKMDAGREAARLRKEAEAAAAGKPEKPATASKSTRKPAEVAPEAPTEAEPVSEKPTAVTGNTAVAKSVKPKPAPATPVTVSVATEPKAVNPTPEEGPSVLSPIEKAALIDRSPRDGEKKFEITPLLFRQIQWGHIDTYPEGRKVSGYKQFRGSFDNAVERQYVSVNIGEAAAKYLLGSVLKGAFAGDWEPVTEKGKASKSINTILGGVKRFARTFAGELAEAFSLEVPKVIADYSGIMETRAGVPKKAPGRPKKEAPLVSAVTEEPVIKRGPGRPKKAVTPTPVPVRRKLVAKKS